MTKATSRVTTLDDEQAPAEAAQASTPAISSVGHEEELSGQTRTVTIHPTDGDGGSDAVFVQLNGYAYQIPRGKPVEVPAEVLGILQNATQTLYAHGTGGAVIERQVPRFAFSAT